ncbi:MAG: hypothetical protein ACRC0G_04370 [Fusobacteriaceae bacterium]
MIKIKRISKIRKKSKISPIGTNCDFGVDNIITLGRSSNDVFDGVFDYLFYKVIGCSPVEHINTTDYDFVYDDDSLEEMDKNYYEYDSKYDKEISKTLKKQIDESIRIIRYQSLKDDVIEEFAKGRYRLKGNRYSLMYIIGIVIKAYREGELC